MRIFLLLLIFSNTVFSGSLTSYWEWVDNLTDDMDAVSDDLSQDIGESLIFAPCLIANKFFWETAKLPWQVTQVGKSAYQCYVRYNTIDTTDDQKFQSLFDAIIGEGGRLSAIFLPKSVNIIAPLISTARRRVITTIFIASFAKDDNDEISRTNYDLDEKIKKAFIELQQNGQPVHLKELLEKLR